MTYLLTKIRLTLLNIFAFIFTLAITILFCIFKILIQLPLPTSSYILKDFSHSLTCCCGRISLPKSLFLIINSTLSLLSALAIANYCQKMLGIVEWTSHSIHMVFLNLVFPKFPQPFTYTPSWIVHIYLAFGYLGISSQLSLTLDLMYMYNLPAIYIYKILAFLYSKLLSFIKICIQIIEYDQSRWLACPYSFLRFTKNINQLIALGSIIILGQVLLIVGFYYLWLTIVILMLILAMNFVKNILKLVYRLSQLLLIVKGYSLQDEQKENFSQQENQNISLWKVKLERIKKLDYHWIPLIKLKDIRDVFVGKDIIKGYVQEQTNRNQTFRPSKIYESFTGNHNE